MENHITQTNIQDGIERAHELRSLAFFEVLEALTSPFKAPRNRPSTD